MTSDRLSMLVPGTYRFHFLNGRTAELKNAIQEYGGNDKDEVYLEILLPPVGPYLPPASYEALQAPISFIERTPIVHQGDLYNLYKLPVLISNPSISFKEYSDGILMTIRGETFER